MQRKENTLNETNEAEVALIGGRESATEGVQDEQ
jgi:hypothetical protein